MGRGIAREEIVWLQTDWRLALRRRLNHFWDARGWHATVGNPFPNSALALSERARESGLAPKPGGDICDGIRFIGHVGK
jgi:hypothetical protein